MTVTVVDETAKVARYAIRKGDRYLSWPSGKDQTGFVSSTIYDAIKFDTVADAEDHIRHLFDVPPPTRWDGKTMAPDPDAPPHIGRYHGEDKSDLQIVATNT